MPRTPAPRRVRGVPPTEPAFLPTERARADPPRAIVVLGCAVRLDAEQRLRPGPLARRIEAAAHAYGALGGPGTVVIASGGRRWGSFVEADVIAVELGRRGVPAAAVVRERASLSTRDNARFSAALLSRRALVAAAVVTCPWHMHRATALFVRAGVLVTPVPAGPDGSASLAKRTLRGARERLLTWLDRATLGPCAEGGRSRQ